MKVTQLNDGFKKATLELTLDEMEYLKSLKALIFDLTAFRAGKEIISIRNLDINLSFANFKRNNKIELIYI